MQVWLAPKPLPVTVHEAFASSSPQHPDLCSSFSGTLSPNTLQGSPFHVPWALTVESLSYHSMNFILILPFAAHWENNQPMKKKNILWRAVQMFNDTPRGPPKARSFHTFSCRLVSRSFGIP